MFTIIIITVSAVLILLTLIALIWLITANTAANREMAKQTTSITLLQQQLEAIRTSQDQHSQTLEKNLQTSRKDIDKVLQDSRQTLSRLHTQIGELKGSSQQMLQLGTDVRTLHDILKGPKLRGQLGERSLENLLRDILPADSFQLQHTFKNGKIVDCLVKLPDYSVPIDAKFPLPAFEAMLKADSDDEKKRLRRQFQQDITKHIDKIAANYINPDQQTLDFALMYIPAENVYYETVIKYDSDKVDILNYALAKKVIPISPNLLYAYLMTIVMGLHGLQIEAQAAQIRQNLRKILSSFDAFYTNWDVLGKHLRNAQSQYDEAQSKLNKFTLQLDQIQTSEEEEQQ
jgi:DNA recombination protein RmuC